MSWPTNPIPTSGLESDTDALTEGRPNIKSTTDAVNVMIAGRSAASGVAGLDSTSKVIESQLRQSISAETKTANYTVVQNDNGKTFICTGAPTITLANTLQVGFNVTIKNGNLGVSDEIVTVIAQDSTIERQSEIVLRPGEGNNFLVQSTEIFTLGDIELQNIAPFVLNKHNYYHDMLTVRESFNQFNVAKDVWRSVGKSTSGADYIYTELNVIPAVPAFAKIRIAGTTIQGSSGQLRFNAYIRPFTSSDAPQPSLLLAEAACNNDSIIAFYGEKIVPIDTFGRFSILWQESGSGTPNTAFNCYLEAFYL